ncbi:MAG TPA: hypothetical protein VIM84_05630 [Gemmatimonadales bacterium]
MPHLNSPARPFRRNRGLMLAGLPAVLAISLVGSSFAQSGPPGHEGPHNGPRPAMRSLGPVSPEILRDSIGVTGAKLDQYTKKYQSYMASTKPARDSLRNELASARSAYQKGDTTAFRNKRPEIRKQAQALRDRDKKFEEGLKDILSSDQQKRYASWRESQMKLAQARMHDWRKEHGHNHGAAPYGRDSTTTRSDSARS